MGYGFSQELLGLRIEVLGIKVELGDTGWG